jgi:hypothetical protein
MATTAQVASAVTEVQTVADLILATIEKSVPSVAGEATITQEALDLLAEMVAKAMGAWSAASGVAITADSVQALLPNQTPLTAPTS